METPFSLYFLRVSVSLWLAQLFQIFGEETMNTIWQDLSLGARMLLKRPGFTLTAALTLALGIGATTAMFSVVNGVLLRRLPYGDEARVVVLWQNNLKNGVEREETSPANFFDWRDRAQSLDIVSAAEPFAFNLSGTGEPETFRSWIVTAGFFDALSVLPLYGRTFLPEEYEPGKGQVIVIGYGLWQRRFGGDPNLVGRQLTLNGQPHTIIGILPPEFQYTPGGANCGRRVNRATTTGKCAARRSSE